VKLSWAGLFPGQWRQFRVSDSKEICCRVCRCAIFPLFDVLHGLRGCDPVLGIYVVTAPQCLEDLSSWETKDEDNKAKVELPNLWYQKLSTEELVRLDAEGTYCTLPLRHAHHKEEAQTMPYFGRSFAAELIGKMVAENPT
jgi:hypothetical protein